MNLDEIFNRLKVDFRRTTNGEYLIYCPRGRRGAHKPKRKLYVNPEVVAKGHKGVFHCFQCDGKEQPYQGIIAKLIKDLGGDSKWWEGDSGKVVSSDLLSRILMELELAPRETPREIVELELPEELSTDFERTRVGRLALRYLRQRHVSDEKISRYEIGFCGNGKFGGYTILPVRQNGRLFYFQARKFLKSKTGPKYLNPMGQMDEDGKSSFLYGYDFFDRKRGPVILVEGAFDAISVGSNALGIFGKSLSAKQLRKIENLRPRDAIVMLDSDAYEEAMGTARQLSEIMPVSVARLSKSKDPGSASREELVAALARAEAFDAATAMEKVMAAKFSRSRRRD